MKRRTFIHTSLLATGGLLFQAHGKVKKAPTKLASIRGGSATEMLDLAIEAMGGLQKYIGAGQKILVKPTMRWNQASASGRNTNPDLLGLLVRRCYEAGSRGVYLFDQTIDPWTKCYKNSGIERAVKDAGAKIIPGDKEFLYQPASIPGAKVLSDPKLHQLAHEADLIINVPAVQELADGTYFGAFQNMLNLMWNYQSEQQQAEAILDLLRFKKPTLTLVDACQVPGNDTIHDYKSLFLSTDMVAAEAYAVKRLGIDPTTLNYLQLAQQESFGQITLAPENIRSIVLKNSKS